MTALMLASLHHLVFFGLIAMLATQMALLRVTPLPVERISKVDIGYGAAATLMLVVGITRVFWGEKGWAFYAENHFFWTKMGLFVLIGLASIRPTLTYLRWRKAAKRDTGFTPDAREISQVRATVLTQMILFGFVLVAAAGMARWPL